MSKEVSKGSFSKEIVKFDLTNFTLVKPASTSIDTADRRKLIGDILEEMAKDFSMKYPRADISKTLPS